MDPVLNLNDDESKQFCGTETAGALRPPFREIVQIFCCWKLVLNTYLLSGSGTGTKTFPNRHCNKSLRFYTILKKSAIILLKIIPRTLKVLIWIQKVSTVVPARLQKFADEDLSNNMNFFIDFAGQACDMYVACWKMTFSSVWYTGHSAPLIWLQENKRRIQSMTHRRQKQEQYLYIPLFHKKGCNVNKFSNKNKTPAL